MELTSPRSTSTGFVSPTDRLDTLPLWSWEPDDPAAQRTLGWEAVRWAEGRGRWSRRAGGFGGLIQPNGPRAGRPFRFTKRQMRFLLWWYAVDEQGHWLFNHGVRRLAKGSGKSPFAAVVSLLELCGPVRLERFDARQWGGCVGRSVDMPLVQIAATAESQTSNTMRMVRAFAPKGSPVVEAYHLDPGKTQYYMQPEGTLQVITSSYTAAEGAEGTSAVADETEHWRPANGGSELSSTLLDNLAKSGCRMIETANSPKPGAETVAEESLDAWVAQEEGRTRGETRILYDAVKAPPDTDLADPESLRGALEFVYADCDWKKPHVDGEPVSGSKPDVRPIMERIWSPKSRPDDSMRKYLNWPTADEDAWTTPQEWAVLTDATRVVEDGEDVALFFDGSKSRDATALVGCCVEDGHVFAVDVWEPDPAHDTVDVVPVADVDLTVRRAADRWNVVGFLGDVLEWESFVKVSWPEAFPDLEVMAVPSGKDPQPIAWDMRGHVYEFTLAAELCLDEIAAGAFTHDGDSRLARHVANMRRRPNRYGVSVGKESRSSPKKIDGGVCVIGARMVRRLVLAHRAQQPKPKKRAGRVIGWN
jgi:hypothetical protein